MDMELMLIQSAVLVVQGLRRWLTGAAGRPGGSVGESVPGEGVRREIVTLLYSASRPVNAEDCCSWSQVIKLLEREDVEPLDEVSDRVEEGGVSIPTSAACCECRDSVVSDVLVIILHSANKTDPCGERAPGISQPDRSDHIW